MFSAILFFVVLSALCLWFAVLPELHRVQEGSPKPEHDECLRCSKYKQSLEKYSRDIKSLKILKMALIGCIITGSMVLLVCFWSVLILYSQISHTPKPCIYYQVETTYSADAELQSFSQKAIDIAIRR